MDQQRVIAVFKFDRKWLISLLTELNYKNCISYCDCMATDSVTEKRQNFVLTQVRRKCTVSWDVTPCRPESSQRFGGTYRLNLGVEEQDRKEQLVSCLA
jgi:hypothetical protein